MRFVVHEHHASHLHYDLRLEHKGVLKSWAIPKEPPLKLGVKRLAVQVEDHNLDYINFEGVIPEGTYGAGKVLIWDKGEYTSFEWKTNKIKLNFHGEKLKGLYNLIEFPKAGEKYWLFFKISD